MKNKNTDKFYCDDYLEEQSKVCGKVAYYYLIHYSHYKGDEMDVLSLCRCCMKNYIGFYKEWGYARISKNEHSQFLKTRILV